MGKAKGSEKTGGRTKGVSNKVTSDTREAFKKLVEDNTDKFQGWLDKIAESNPAKAFELITNLSEYVLPKLSRTEFVGELEVKTNDNLDGYSDEDLKKISEIREKNELQRGSEKTK